METKRSPRTTSTARSPARRTTATCRIRTTTSAAVHVRPQHHGLVDVLHVAGADATRCAATRRRRSADQIIGDAKISFDGQAYGTAPTKGDVTQIEHVERLGQRHGDLHPPRPGPSTTPTAASLDTWDVDNNHTTTAYTPATGGPVTRTTVTNPLGCGHHHRPRAGLGPAPPASLTRTAAHTDVTYDPLGRTTAVWLPGRAKGVRSANMTYAYLIRY